MGAEQNHLCPTIVYSAPAPPPLTGVASVVLARTSEPPCFSVMAIPEIAQPFSLAGISRGSYVVAVTSGSHSAASSGCARSAGTTAKVMVMGHAKPASACMAVMYRAARAVCAEGSSLVHGSECSSFSTPIFISWCHAGWNSTSSMRCP